MMANVAAAAQAEKDQMQRAASPSLKPQSRSAVHYLAISPPRIRVTDAQGRKYAKGLVNRQDGGGTD